MSVTQPKSVLNLCILLPFFAEHRSWIFLIKTVSWQIRRCQMCSLLLHNKYYKLLQCLPVDYAPILGKSNYFLSLPHKLIKSSLKKNKKQNKTKPFCKFSFFLCPHLLLCDGRSVIMRSGFFTRKTSVSSLYFLMYFPPALPKEAYGV